MEHMSFTPRIKTEDELQEQLKKANTVLGVAVEPQSWETLSLLEMKEKYKVRLDAYMMALKAERSGIQDAEAFTRAREHVTALNNLDIYIEKNKDKKEDVRDERHLSVYQDLQSFLEEGKNKGYIKLPTGVGKTVIFIRLIEALGLKTLIVVPTKVLVQQTGERLEEFTEVEYGMLYSNQKDFSSHAIITTYASLISNVKNNQIKPRDWPLVILDEAHRALGEETRATLERFDGIQIGFTATAVFSEDKSVATILPEIIHSMSLTEAIEEGALSTTQTIHAFTEVDLSSVPLLGNNYNEKALEKAVNTIARNKAAVELYQQAFMGRKAVAYCAGVAHAKDCTKMFNESGIPAACITQDTEKEEREKIFKQFKTGEILVLCNARILIEGFDEPTCSLVLNLHPSRSYVDVEQRGGRALRLDTNDSNKIGVVVDFIDKADDDKKSVLFSEILGSAFVPARGKKASAGTNENNLGPIETEEQDGEPLDLSFISIEGLRVTVDAREIMTVSNEFKILRIQAQEKKTFSFKTLQAEVRDAEVKSSPEYKTLAPQRGWLSAETLTSKPEWRGWDDFLGREAFSFETLQAEVRDAEVKSSGEYKTLAPQRGWLSVDALIKKPEWRGWDDFLGRESKQVFTFKTLQDEVRAAEVKSSPEYKTLAPQRGWLSVDALIKKPEWRGWDDFLAREAFSFETLQAEVRAAGVKSSREYEKLAPQRGWLSANALIKKPEWRGWDDFLAREAFSFETLQAEVRDAEVKSSGEYKTLAPQRGWLSVDALIKKPEWRGWDDFLGREIKKNG